MLQTPVTFAPNAFAIWTANVPTPLVLDVELEEVVVTAAEQRRTQRAHERELVARIVDRAQRHQQIADLAGRVHE